MAIEMEQLRNFQTEQLEQKNIQTMAEFPFTTEPSNGRSSKSLSS